MTKNCKHLFHLQFALAKKYRKFVENKKLTPIPQPYEIE